MKEDYIYGVARVHVREAELLNRQDIEQLLTATSYDDAVQMLAEKGYTGDDSKIENLISARRKSLWEFLQELGVSPQQLSMFRADIDFHNLKVAVKSQILSEDAEMFMMDFGNIAPKQIQKAVQERDFSDLPSIMGRAGQNALDILLKTRDGQLCDVILDRAALESVYKAGRDSDIPLVREYVKLKTALTDIKIAVRCCLTEKSLDFIDRALAVCEGLDVHALALAAAKDLEAVYTCLFSTEYDGAVAALKESMSAFEKWCDNQVMQLIRQEKSKCSTLSPIIAYLLAVENEMKIVRLILSGKKNQLEENLIRERVRELYG
ncbi:V-type ATPase subunit [Ructibacterium gallinarum]|uniref:V-type ATPase subunit n=1 Tax=Ructibacterium gallinarum TaxID=2779355 RepID=A0A9D5M3U5_9FIRM|nr:V-type ATPase subunit [Ructibacterium gallinarum]MBE5040115.1 V-type ATPase subunit [Ructibacterium gallinarum]